MKLRSTLGKGSKPDKQTANPSLDFADSDPLPFTSPKAHHHISESKRFKEDIPTWLGVNAEDPAMKVCHCA